MRDVVICAATDAHAVALAATMRASDVAEVEASGEPSPLAAVRRSMLFSSHTAAALTADGRVICIYGVGAMGFLSNTGCPWFLASDLLGEYRRELIARSRSHLSAVLDLYPELENFVDARAVGAIRWLRWLGFKVSAPMPCGPREAMFCRFTMTRAPLSIQQSTFAAISAAETFPALTEEYGLEAGVVGLPRPEAKVDTYRALEAAGALHVFSATKDGDLIGFVIVLAPMSPHYSVIVAACESFFVAKAHRKTGAGLRLLRAAENRARDLGSPGLLVSAPFAGDLFKVLPRVGYAEVSRSFFKRLGDE